MGRSDKESSSCLVASRPASRSTIEHWAPSHLNMAYTTTHDRTVPHIWMVAMTAAEGEEMGRRAITGCGRCTCAVSRYPTPSTRLPLVAATPVATSYVGVPRGKAALSRGSDPAYAAPGSYGCRPHGAIARPAMSWARQQTLIVKDMCSAVGQCTLRVTKLAPTKSMNRPASCALVSFPSMPRIRSTATVKNIFV